MLGNIYKTNKKMTISLKKIFTKISNVIIKSTAQTALHTYCIGAGGVSLVNGTVVDYLPTIVKLLRTMRLKIIKKILPAVL